MNSFASIKNKNSLNFKLIDTRRNLFINIADLEEKAR